VLDQTGIAGEYDSTLESQDINMGRTQRLDEELAEPSIFYSYTGANELSGWSQARGGD
jgi:hypothetical protein